MMLPRSFLAALALGACAACSQVESFDVVAPPADATMDAAREGGGGGDGGGFDMGPPMEVGPRCTPAQMVCNGLCTSVMTDSNNCGTCGHACGEEMACYAGMCRTACPTGLTGCTDPTTMMDVCVDIQNSRFNCGACGHACPAAATCSAGVCILDCGTRTLCSGGGGGDAGTDGGGGGGSDGGGDGGVGSGAYCADLTFDSANCGACGHACPTNYLCTSARCVISCVFPQTGCPPAGTMTMSFCANLNTDVMNCGTCGHACPAGQTCTGGACACTAPALACGAACVNPNTDVANCGACGRACAAGQYCASGTCTTCAPRTLCPGGLCVDTTTDVNNCGACARVCPTGNVCQAGTCICPTATGSAICGGTCVNLNSDVMHCGSCTTACAVGQVCAAGRCINMITGYTSGPLPASVVWVNACAAPGATTGVQSGVDDGMGPSYTLPFMFRFFENAYTQVTPSADGYLGFGTTGTNWGSYGTYVLSPPASFAPHPALFAYSRDLYQRTGECFAVIGAAPNRSVVWEVNDAYHYFDATTHLTFEVFLNEGTNTIDLIYQTLSGPGTDGSQASVGMINATATHSAQYEASTAGTLMSGTRIRFTPM